MLLKKKKEVRSLEAGETFLKFSQVEGKYWGWLGQKQPAIVQYIDQKYNFILESYSVYFIS